MFRSRLILIAAVVAVLFAIISSGVQPAQASLWQMSDGFEGSPSAVWSFEGTISPNNSAFKLNSFYPLVHTGVNSAEVGLCCKRDTTSDWLSVKRTVRITPFMVGRALSCTAAVWISIPDQSRINFEVIDPDTWTYVSLNATTQAATTYPTYWRKLVTSTWNPPHQNVVIRVTRIFGDNWQSWPQLRVDDLAVSCQYY